jgi:hypothetical protein
MLRDIIVAITVITTIADKLYSFPKPRPGASAPGLSFAALKDLRAIAVL